MSLTSTMLPRRSCSSSPSTGCTNSLHPSRTRLPRRRSSAQRFVSTSAWAARSPTPFPLTLEAHTPLADLVAEPFTSKLEEVHEVFNGVASLIDSWPLNFKEETQGPRSMRSTHN